MRRASSTESADDGEFALLFLMNKGSPRSLVYADILSRTEHAIKQFSTFLFAHRVTRYYPSRDFEGFPSEVFSEIVSPAVCQLRATRLTVVTRDAPRSSSLLWELFSPASSNFVNCAPCRCKHDKRNTLRVII